ncbi:MAG: cupin domain-containing protein [Muribaculaceae bacterium]|nr:cupin domain-containing protein [Muribaculaceae bacterium]
MQIIMLSGGSGTRLWPLSNDARSKQFLKFLPVEGSEERESMVQRVVRQIHESGLDAGLTVATAACQRDAIEAQLGRGVDVVTEPERRKTMPAICLAAEYLAREKGCADDETVVVIPCDPFTGEGYFEAVRRMAECVEGNVADLMLMGITPTYPSAKYGYVVPEYATGRHGAFMVRRFVEKPAVDVAERLIAEHALWSGGVFAFRLGYLLRIARRYVDCPTFEGVREHFDEYPAISFDYGVVEHEASMAVVPFGGEWRDLGTWLTLTDELRHSTYGNVITDGRQNNTHIINELEIPLMCIGTSDLVIAASPDGILVSEKNRSEDIKLYADRLKARPMFEERRWGWYKVIDQVEFPDGYCALTKQLTVNPGCALSYQQHACRDEVWTFIQGSGEIVLNGERRPVKRGDTVFIPKGSRHALRADTLLTFIEVQSGSNLVEEDITRFPYDW